MYQKQSTKSLKYKKFLECQVPQQSSGMSHSELPENTQEAIYKESKICMNIEILQ